MGRVVVAAAAVLLVGGCSYIGPDPVPYTPRGVARAARPEEGSAIYMRDCAWCHGSKGEGTASAPDLLTGTNGSALTHFMVSSGRMPLDYPEQVVERREVGYTEEEIAAIVAYTGTFGAPGPPIPEVRPEEAELSHGLELYHENCTPCHSTTGIGGALTAGRGTPARQSTSVVAPGLHDSTPVQTAEAVRVGPGTMPVFSAETFDQDELDAIVAYVEYLRDPVDAGGAPLGRVGPVVEGAVGWVVCLGLLVAFVRWVGTKRGDV